MNKIKNSSVAGLLFIVSMQAMEAPQPITTQKEKLFTYIKKGFVTLFKKKLPSNAKVDERDHEGYTLLHTACIHAQPSIVAHLLERGADVNARTHYSLMTPLHCAIGFEKESIAIAKLLLAHNADPTLGDCSGLTPLYYAAASGCADLVSIIIVHAQYNAQHARKNISMHEAVQLLTDYRMQEGKKLITMRNENTLTGLQIARIRLAVMSKRDDLLEHEIKQKVGFAQIIPLLELDLFEQNYKTLIQQDVIRSLA